MSDRLESRKLVGVVEDDPGQRLATYLAFEDDFGPARRHWSKSLGIEDPVPNRVGIDGLDAMFGQ
jgi:hypothetical protein